MIKGTLIYRTVSSRENMDNFRKHSVESIITNADSLNNLLILTADGKPDQFTERLDMIKDLGVKIVYLTDKTTSAFRSFLLGLEAAVKIEKYGITFLDYDDSLLTGGLYTRFSSMTAGLLYTRMDAYKYKLEENNWVVSEKTKSNYLPVNISSVATKSVSVTSGISLLSTYAVREIIPLLRRFSDKMWDYIWEDWLITAYSMFTSNFKFLDYDTGIYRIFPYGIAKHGMPVVDRKFKESLCRYITACAIEVARKEFISIPNRTPPPDAIRIAIDISGDGAEWKV